MLRKILKKVITTVNDFYEYIHYLLRIHEIFCYIIVKQIKIGPRNIVVENWGKSLKYKSLTNVKITRKNLLGK